MILSIVITAVVAYFLGNLNGAVLISRAVAHEDVRTKGSGNAGLTNFTRNYGSAASIFVIAIDVGKAVAGCFLGGLLLKSYGHYLDGVALGGLFVILGHDFPVLLGFKGGKGILSGVTVALMMDWRIGLGVFGIFLLAYFLTKYVSLGGPILRLLRLFLRLGSLGGGLVSHLRGLLPELFAGVDAPGQYFAASQG